MEATIANKATLSNFAPDLFPFCSEMETLLLPG